MDGGCIFLLRVSRVASGKEKGGWGSLAIQGCGEIWS